MEDKFYLNHKICVDNFYNNFNLSVEIINLEVFCCGTMSSYRGETDFYKTLKQSFKKNDFICNQKNNINISLWYDKKVLSFTTTFHNFESEIKGDLKIKIYEKLEMIKNYNTNISGVDRYDQQLHTYFYERKSKKWSNKLAVYLINLLIHNWNSL